MYKIICNPVAGKGKTQKLAARLEEYLRSKNVDYSLHFSDSAEHVRRLAAQLSKGGGNIICMGGDGTLHGVLNGIEDLSQVTLGIIPCGTGNDFAKTLGLPLGDVAAAADIILGGAIAKADYIMLGDKRALNVTGMGLDVEVLERMRRAKLIKGRLQYYLSLLRSLLTFRWNEYRISVDGGENKFHCAMITAVCNGKYFGGGMMISPKSDPFDGKLDVIIVNRISRLRIPFALLSFFTGKLLKNKFVDHIRCEQVEFITSAKPSINADGELVYGQSFHCSVVKAGLNVFVPK